MSPDGTAQSLAPMVSSAYGVPAVTTGGPINENGQILIGAIIGQSSRLLRMVPISGCSTGCILARKLSSSVKLNQQGA